MSKTSPSSNKCRQLTQKTLKESQTQNFSDSIERFSITIFSCVSSLSDDDDNVGWGSGNETIFYSHSIYVMFMLKTFSFSLRFFSHHPPIVINFLCFCFCYFFMFSDHNRKLLPYQMRKWLYRFYLVNKVKCLYIFIILSAEEKEKSIKLLIDFEKRY